MHSLTGIKLLRYKHNITFSSDNHVTKSISLKNKFAINPRSVQEMYQSGKNKVSKIRVSVNLDGSFAETLNSTNNEDKNVSYKLELGEQTIQEADIEESPKKLK
eukprot:TRINITY_DN9283_c0_g1_i2.p1 TRINITY_DN9283_c0_g1~~TRINITY_DN9283_c0_g1_i2.p1  ORF type:complete len:104 (+),score=29.79 TRINITY_DN9283_c0_g1_i2:209-520(+)